MRYCRLKTHFGNCKETYANRYNLGWRSLWREGIVIVRSENICSSSHRRRSIEKHVLKNLAKLTGKHLWQSLFFHKVLKESLAGVLFVNFEKFLRTPILQNTSRRLVLYISAGVARSPSNILNGEIYKNSMNNMLQKSPSQIFAGGRDYASDTLQWYGNCCRSVSKVYQSVSKILFSDVPYSDLIIFLFQW